MNAGCIRILVVDDHPLLRLGVVTSLSQVNGFQIVGDADNAASAFALARLERPDVVLLDIRLGDRTSGVDLARDIRRALPATKLIVLSNFDQDPYIRTMLEVGVEGYLLKDTAPAEIAEAVRMVMGGRTVFSSKVSKRMIGGYLDWSNTSESHRNERLTPKEIEVLQLLASEMPTDRIADRLAISSKGVEQHLSNIFAKLGVRNRTSALLRAAKQGLIVVDDDEFTG